MTLPTALKLYMRQKSMPEVLTQSDRQQIKAGRVSSNDDGEEGDKNEVDDESNGEDSR